MLIEEMLKFRPLWAPEDGTGGGDDTGGDTGGNTGGDDGDKADDGSVVLGGQDDGSDEGKTDDKADTGGDDDGDDKSKDDDKSEDDKQEDGDIEYDFTGVLPEGMQMDETMAAAMTPAFKALKLTQEQASELVKVYAEHQAEAAKTNAQQISTMMKQWVDAAKNDAEIGKAQWDKSVKSANAVLKKFGTPELVQDVMVGQGFGNHPEVIRVFARIGAAMADDTFTKGSTPNAEQPIENRWYGSTTKSVKG